ncbi:nucleoside-triphosphatase THEP1 [Nitrobacteraceae bacterium AZCC 2161]
MTTAMKNNARESNAELRAKLKTLVVKNRRLDLIEERILEMLADTEVLVADDLLREKEAEELRQSITYTELWALPIIGPTGSTKTTSMESIAEKLKRRRRGNRPVLMVKCRASTRTAKQLQVQILEAFGDPQAELMQRRVANFSHKAAMDAIRKVARGAGTHIVVLDEVHNMLGRDKRANAATMAVAIKSLVNDGVFSIVVMGTKDAHLLFQVDAELNSRKFDEISLEPASLSDEQDYEYFFKFVGRVEREMADLGIIDKRIGLIDDIDSRAKIYDLADGVVGVVSRVLMLALRISQRDGRRSIGWDDIKHGFWTWKADQKDDDGNPIAGIYDPFKSNTKPTTNAAIREMSKKLKV